MAKASPFQLQSGETVHYAFQVPSPTWFDVAGRIIGNLPISHENFHLSFQRDMGILPDVGGIGFPISADGRFQGMLQKGLYFCIRPRDDTTGTERLYKGTTPVRFNSGED